VTYWCQKWDILRYLEKRGFLRLVLTVSNRCLLVFVSSIRLRIFAAPVPHVPFSLGGQLSTGQVVRSSLYFEQLLISVMHSMTPELSTTTVSVTIASHSVRRRSRRAFAAAASRRQPTHIVRRDCHRNGCPGKRGRHGMRHGNQHLFSVTEKVSRKPRDVRHGKRCGRCDGMSVHSLGIHVSCDDVV